VTGVDKSIVVRLHSSFEEMLRKEPETGVEFWLARDLQMLLGYARWENFVKVIEKAITACRATGYEPLDHFRDITKMVDVGSGAKREVRRLLKDRGITPEKLPTGEDVKKVERRLKSEQRKLPKQVEAEKEPKEFE
jgi:hypothetical protein